MIVSSSDRRRGFIAVALVMTLAVVTILGGSLFRAVVLRRADLRSAERRLQAEWLAQSGMGRAMARLSKEPDYAGETWELTAAEFGGRGDGAVVIKVEAVTGKPSLRLIRVRADYPKAEARRARESIEQTIEFSSARKEEDPK